MFYVYSSSFSVMVFWQRTKFIYSSSLFSIDCLRLLQMFDSFWVMSEAFTYLWNGQGVWCFSFLLLCSPYWCIHTETELVRVRYVFWRCFCWSWEASLWTSCPNLRAWSIGFFWNLVFRLGMLIMLLDRGLVKRLMLFVLLCLWDWYEMFTNCFVLIGVSISNRWSKILLPATFSLAICEFVA